MRRTVHITEQRKIGSSDGLGPFHAGDKLYFSDGKYFGEVCTYDKGTDSLVMDSVHGSTVYEEMKRNRQGNSVG